MVLKILLTGDMAGSSYLIPKQDGANVSSTWDIYVARTRRDSTLQRLQRKVFLQKQISFSLCDWLIFIVKNRTDIKIACADVTSIFQPMKFLEFYY